MKLPPFNFQFIQLCFVMTMLGLIALTAIFGLRGNMPAWLLMVTGQGKPPAAQMQTVPVPIELDKYIASKNYILSENIISASLERHASVKTDRDIKFSRNFAEFSVPLTVKTGKVAALSQPSLWNSFLTLVALLALIAAGFHKSLPRPSRYLPKRLKALFTTAT